MIGPQEREAICKAIERGRKAEIQSSTTEPREASWSAAVPCRCRIVLGLLLPLDAFVKRGIKGQRQGTAALQDASRGLQVALFSALGKSRMSSGMSVPGCRAPSIAFDKRPRRSILRYRRLCAV